MPNLARAAALALLGGAVLPWLSAAPASALMITISGVDYEVSAVTTSFDSQATAFGLPPLGQMPWWGDDALASEFATEVFSQLGSGWDPDYGPVFAYALDTTLNEVLGLTQSLADINDQIDVTSASNTSISYAIATTTPIPAPAPLLGAWAAFGFSRRLRTKLRNR